jgi:hypothetical protein
LIGATTSRLVGFWLIQACSGATVPFPFSVRPVGRLIEFHPGRFTSAPRRGKRHEKQFCGVGHIPGTVDQHITKLRYSPAGRGQSIAAARSTSRSCSPRRSSS